MIGSGWASVLKTHSSNGNKESSEYNKYKYCLGREKEKRKLIKQLFKKMTNIKVPEKLHALICVYKIIIIVYFAHNFHSNLRIYSYIIRAHSYIIRTNFTLIYVDTRILYAHIRRLCAQHFTNTHKIPEPFKTNFLKVNMGKYL